MKAVIFDLDGVLINSQPFHFDADILVLKGEGIDCGLETVQKYAGIANKERWIKYRKDFGLQKTAEDLIATHVKVMNNYLESVKLSPIDGIYELLSYLKKKKMRIAVASSSSHSFINNVLNKMNIADFFDVITSGEDVTNGKPAPDVFLLAASRLGYEAESCIVIEDSTNGVAAAKAAGIRCIGYVNETSGEQDLSKADIVIYDYREPEKWLECNPS